MNIRRSKYVVTLLLLVSALFVFTSYYKIPQAVQAQPTMILSPASGPRGTVVSITGSGFASPGDNGGCTISSTPLPDITVSSPSCTISGGTLSASFIVASVNPYIGAHTVTVVGITLDSAAATFTVTGPVITLNPTSGPTSTAVTITGSGFDPGDSCGSINVDASTPNDIVSSTFSCVSLTGGSLSASFTVDGPGTDTPGVYTVTIGTTSTSVPDTAHATFTVTTPGPTITLSPISGHPGASVTVTGSGFNPADAGTYDCFTSTPLPDIIDHVLSTCTFASNGHMTGSFAILSGAAQGVHLITAIGSTFDSGSASFTITPAAIITLTPTSGPAGATVTLTGSGFDSGDAGAPYNCLTSTPLPDIINPATASCSFLSNGQMTGSFTLFTNAAPGPHTIQAQGSTGDLATATFTVTSPAPTIALSPPLGHGGILVSVSGSSFNPSDAGSYPCISSTPSPDITTSVSCTFSASGTMTGSFIVLTNAALGAHSVRVQGNTGDFATATFTVTSASPTLILSPSGGPTLTSVQVTVSGFSVTDTTITFTTVPTGLFTGSLSCTPSNGGCTATFTVVATAGAFIVTGTGNTVGDSASAPFNVGTKFSSLSLNPSSGPPGTLVSFTGVVNVSGATTCTVGGGSGNGLGIKTSSCVIVGGPSYPSAFSGSLVVGNQNPGTYTVRISTSGGSSVSTTITIGTSSTTQGTVNYVEATFIVTGPTITLLPTSGRTGTTVTISGVGFSFSDNTCTLSSTPSVITNGQCTINAGTGMPSATFIVSNVAPGTYRVRVTGSTSDFAEANFIVISGPTITLAPSSGTPGVTVVVTGVGFLPTGSTCTISGAPVRTPACTLPVGTGAPTGSFTIGNVAPGSYVITLSSNGGDSAQAVLTVTAISATLIFSLSPGGMSVTTVSPGATVYVRIGTGTLTSTSTTCTLSSSPAGLFSTSVCHVASAGTDLTGTFFMVAASPSGNTYLVIVTDNIGATAVGTIGILFPPSLTLTPTYGSPGNTVSFIGRGLPSTDTSCTVLSLAGPNGALLVVSGTCSISGGTATGSFVVNSLATVDGSPWTVTVTGNPSTNQVTGQFTVVPTISLTPSSGSFGAVISVGGFGFSSKGTSCTLSSVPTGLFASGTAGCNFIVPGPNGNGQISGTFTVAAGIAAGSYVVTATDNGSPANSASAIFTLGLSTAQLTISPDAIVQPFSGQTVNVGMSGSGFNPSDTGCSVTPTPVGFTYAVPACSMNGGFASVALTIDSTVVPGLYLITVIGTPNGDFASNFLSVQTLTTATSTTSSTSTSTTATTTTTFTTSTSVSTSLTSSTITIIGPTTQTFAQGTFLTVSGVTTTTSTTVGFTASPTTATSTTFVTSTFGQMIGPSLSDEVGVLGMLALLLPVLLRRLLR